MTRLIFGPMRPSREDATNGADAYDGSRADTVAGRSESHADAAATRAESHVIGIDAGSKTIKVVVFDPAGNLVYSGYHRHHTDIGSTLADAFHDVRWRLGDIVARIAVTGSAGIEVARLLDVPFVQEVVAVTRAVEHACPDADVIIELGGEDSKIVYLGDDLEQRMNSTCAGGTGGFIDSIAYMLGVRASDMGSLALGASSTYPIASRCAVFAQTDVRPLLNAGASKADIAASVHDAVVRQTLGGLACGRPIEGKVVFLGGPLQFNDGLVFSFRRALGAAGDAAVKPRDAHLFTAFGAAMAAAEGSAVATVGSVEESLRSGAFGSVSDGDLPRLPALFASSREFESFREKHAGPSFPCADIMRACGPLFLGIDAGSTTAKLALIDEEGRLVFSAYEETKGDVVETVRGMLWEAQGSLPTVPRPGDDASALPFVAHAVATGYGEDVLRAAFGVDGGVVETVAHAKAALSLVPDATFVLDIGGQDMKALWIGDGQVCDAVLNEACSSGCGSFLGGTAHAVGRSEISFAECALRSESPVDLGAKCTVFMSSRVKHAQKMGVGVEDIAAGCAYSVVQNVLQRIIGAERVASIGSKAVVQGGTFKSDAVLRAFEVLSGAEAVRPAQAELMGAIGAALVARERYASQGGEGGSGLLGLKALGRFGCRRRSVTCTGCQNSCVLSVMDFGGRPYVSGNKCERGKAVGLELVAAEETAVVRGGEGAEGRESETPPNLVALEQRLIERFGDSNAPDQGRGSVKVGLPLSLNAYEGTPFWHTLFSALGFGVVAPAPDCERSSLPAAWQSVAAESVCYPAKLMHLRVFSLRDKGATYVFLPHFRREWHCAVSCEYADAVADSVGFLRNGEVQTLRPDLENHAPGKICASEKDRVELLRCMEALCEQAGTPLRDGEFAAALDDALAAQHAFEDELVRETDEALEWVDGGEGRHGVVLAGRPYHVDKALSHGIDQMLQDLGFAVLGEVGLRAQARVMKGTPRPLEHDWRSAKQLARLAQAVAQDGRLDMVCLYSFGCGYDAVSLEEVRLILEAAGKPFTALKTDEMVDVSHIRIRLRTLADILRTNISDAPAECIASSESDAPAHGGVCAPEHDAFKLDAEDVAIARTSTPADVCFTARALAGHVVSCLSEHPEAEEVWLPRVCDKCLEEAVPSMVELACGKTPRYVWDDAPSCFEAAVSEGGEEEGSGSGAWKGPRVDSEATEACRVGILGNALHCFEPLMNDDLPNLLRSLGCDPVLPDPRNLASDDVRYKKQLETFREQGVSDVVYVQSFGCMKANVQVRGQMHRLREAFPDMRITVIDFDPDSSGLNRENRIRLAVEAAKRARGL